MPIPLSSHWRSIHAWLVFGCPITGAYQTQGMGEEPVLPFGRMRNAREPATSKKSTVEGSWSARALTDGIVGGGVEGPDGAGSLGVG